MHFEGSTTIQAPRQSLWNFLTDPHRISRCFPGLVSMEVVEPDKEFRFVVKAKLGSIQPTFDLNVTYTTATPPLRARLGVRGKGPNTHIGASSFLMLDELDDGSTEMKWSFDLAAAGLVARVGERLMKDVGQDLTTKFIAAVKETVEAAAAPVGVASAKV